MYHSCKRGKFTLLKKNSFGTFLKIIALLFHSKHGMKFTNTLHLPRNRVTSVFIYGTAVNFTLINQTQAITFPFCLQPHHAVGVLHNKE